MVFKSLPRLQVVCILLFVLVLSCKPSRALQDGELELDCSSADPGSRCNPIAPSLGCLGSSSATGCVASTNACTTCFFSFADPGLESAINQTRGRVAGVLSIAIADPGRWAEFGLLKADVLLQINGNGINNGTDLSKIEEMRKTGTVILKVLRATQDGYSVIKIELPPL